MALEDEVVKWLDGMIKACSDFRAVFEPGDVEFKSEETVEAVEAVESPLKKIRAQEAQEAQKKRPITDEFAFLKEALETDRWPESVNENLICDPNSDRDKIDRSRGIIELMIEENLEGLKFLDYGCGEGHCAFIATEYEVGMSVGYDPESYPNWNSFDQRPDFVITDSFNEARQNGPYDVVVMFDVIDHLKNENPVDVLEKIKSVLKPGGKVYMRCHPFTSKHATHLYHEINKAYTHLVFTEDELKQMVPNPMFDEPSNSSITMPIMMYNKFIEDAGLKVVNRRDIRENVDEFFKIPKIAERIKAKTGFDEFPEFQMSLQFIDYILTV